MDMPQTPSLALPPGLGSNFTDLPTFAHDVIILCAISLTLMLPVSCIRLYSRIWISRSFELEDAACVIATAGATAYTGVLIASLSVVG